MKDSDKDNETILNELYAELLYIMNTTHLNHTIKSFLTLYKRFRYYNGAFFFSENNDSARELIIPISNINEDSFYFMKFKKSLSGRKITNYYVTDKLLKILPTRENIINKLLKEL